MVIKFILNFKDCIFTKFHFKVCMSMYLVCYSRVHLPNIYVIAITEIIMDLHQRIDSIKAIVSSLVLSDPAKLVYAMQQVIKEVGISKFLFSAILAAG